jgi:hypothetical protein
MTFQPPDWWYKAWVGEWSVEATDARFAIVEAPVMTSQDPPENPESVLVRVDLDCATLTPTAEKEDCEDIEVDAHDLQD